jgi:hypothetical protein
MQMNTRKTLTVLVLAAVAASLTLAFNCSDSIIDNPDASSPDKGHKADGGTDAGGGDQVADASIDAGDAGSVDAAADAGEVICVPDRIRCSQDLKFVVQCNKAGTVWDPIDDCTQRCDAVKCIMGCDSGSCVIKDVICNPFQTQCCDYYEHLHPPCDGCVQDDFCVCDEFGVSWSTGENCKTKFGVTCYKTYCRDIPPTTCTPGDRKCVNQDLMQCNVAGTDWEKVQTCPGCCNGKAKPPACVEGTGGDGTKCLTDCDCLANFTCVGFTSKVCRQKCSPVIKCPAGQKCGTGYYCQPE